LVLISFIFLMWYGRGWLSGGGRTAICFANTAGYVVGLLACAGTPPKILAIVGEPLETHSLAEACLDDDTIAGNHILDGSSLN